MNTILAMILAGGQGQRLNILSELRAKPAVPFGGKYRLIDFTLSNCVNSGISQVFLLTQYRPRSLQEHIQIGRPWDLDRMNGGLSMFQPALGIGMKEDWYQGTADAVGQNMNRILSSNVKDIMILSGDHIYKMDYSKMVDFHRLHNADLTIAVMPVDYRDASRFGILQLNEHRKIIHFEEKPREPKSNLASMGIYLFKREILDHILKEDAKDPESSHDFGKDIIPSMIHRYGTYGYEFNGYWRDVGTVPSYFESNMDLLQEPPLFDLDDPEWPIHTKNEERSPVRLNQNAKVIQSLIANGCIINGYVENSILFPGVVVEYGAVVRNSIIFSDTHIGSEARIVNTICDKYVHIGMESQIGSPELSNLPQNGITLIGKRTRLPSYMDIGGGCIIDSDLHEDDFISRDIPDGSILKKRTKSHR